MPSLGGREVLAEIRRWRPAIPGLFCSGYAAPASYPGVADESARRSRDPADLLRRVRAILNSSRS